MQHYIAAQFLEKFNRSLDWVLSHWAHFTVCRFIFVYVYFVFRYFVLYYCKSEVDLVGLKPDP